MHHNSRTSPGSATPRPHSTPLSSAMRGAGQPRSSIGAATIAAANTMLAIENAPDSQVRPTPSAVSTG